MAFQYFAMFHSLLECKFHSNFWILLFALISLRKCAMSVFMWCCLVAQENITQSAMNFCWLWIVRRRRRKCLFYAYFNYAFIQFSLTGSSTQIRHLALRSLLPNTDQYMTYEGSTTHPGCWESTVWIILNKPIYITKQEVIYTCLSLSKQQKKFLQIHG